MGTLLQEQHPNGAYHCGSLDLLHGLDRFLSKKKGRTYRFPSALLTSSVTYLPILLHPF